MEDNAKAEYIKGLSTYLIGFFASLVLTIIAFVMAAQAIGDNDFLSRGTLIFFLATLASLQLIVQVVFFLHMSTERKARWSLLSGLFATTVILILVVGSIWVMNNLNYNMMPKDTTQYMQNKEAIHKSHDPAH